MNAKKIVTAGLALVMVAGISVAGTLAYLTSTTGEVKNTFTVGKVAITLDESKYDPSKPDGLDKEVRMKAGQDYGTITPATPYPKDPTVHVDATSQECYVFVKVVNGLSTNEAAQSAAYDTIEKQITDTYGWTKYDDGIYYKENVKPGANLQVFDEFCVASGVTNNTELGDIVIQAAAVQTAGINDVDDAYDAISGSFTI